jgi:hypothetical protein
MIATIQSEAAYSPPIEPNLQTSVAKAGFRQPIDRTKWAPVIKALRDLRTLRNDWDGEGSDAPPHELIETAIRLVPVLREWGAEIPASAVASRAGTIIFEWRDGPRYVEIEVVGPNRLEWMTVDERGNATHRHFSLPTEPSSGQGFACVVLSA